ncbi:MAG: polysaccharide deacetylase family protein [Bacteroidota bacterium]|nr:polysaccharide deacetylase family protein [Bacteroidota bacterium]
MKQIFGSLLLLCAACHSVPGKINDKTKQETLTSGAAIDSAGKDYASLATVKVPAPAVILKKKQIPVLCYHQIRDWKPADSKTSRTYIVPPVAFATQMKMLADSGYHSVSPDQVYAYLITGAALPPKPIMLTFDDTDLDQFTIAYPEMKKYGFKGVFFIMTVSLGRKHYMSKDQVRQLSDEGHSIESHTWDHHNVKKYSGNDWVTQIDKPTKELESITGKAIRYFAYPFGLWNTAAIPELKKRGFLAAFQLNEKLDQTDPLYSLRRIIVPGTWNGSVLHNWIQRDF